MEIITRKQVKTLLRKAVKDRGKSFRYKDLFNLSYVRSGGCQYAVNGKPACIVGYVLDQIDPTIVQKIGRHRRVNKSTIDYEEVERFLSDSGIQFSDEARYLLMTAQIEQDNGETWGKAVETAINRDNYARSLS